MLKSLIPTTIFRGTSILMEIIYAAKERHPHFSPSSSHAFLSPSIAFKKTNIPIINSPVNRISRIMSLFWVQGWWCWWWLFSNIFPFLLIHFFYYLETPTCWEPAFSSPRNLVPCYALFCFLNAHNSSSLWYLVCLLCFLVPLSLALFAPTPTPRLFPSPQLPHSSTQPHPAPTPSVANSILIPSPSALLNILTYIDRC